MTPSEALKQWRLAHGLIQEQAAELAGVALSTFRAWEAGKEESAGPGALYLQRLEHARPGLLELLARQSAHTTTPEEA